MSSARTRRISDYLEFQRTVNANIRDGSRIRQHILLRKFLAHDPEFVNLLDPTALAKSGIRGGITAGAGRIVTLVGKLNEQHSAKYGEDLFKATNRTAQAQANLGKAIEDFDDYKSFIDDFVLPFPGECGGRASISAWRHRSET